MGQHWLRLHHELSQHTLSWAGSVSYFIMVSGAGLWFLALRFLMASPAYLAGRLRSCRRRSVSHSRPKGRDDAHTPI